MKIEVTDTVRLVALLKALPKSQLHDGGTFFAEDLQDDWSRVTGLRQRDLELAISNLLRRGQILPIDKPLNRYTLTHSGAQYLRRGYFREHGLLKRLRAWLVLIYAPRRHQKPAFRKQSFRKSDHAHLS